MTCRRSSHSWKSNPSQSWSFLHYAALPAHHLQPPVSSACELPWDRSWKCSHGVNWIPPNPAHVYEWPPKCHSINLGVTNKLLQLGEFANGKGQLTVSVLNSTHVLFRWWLSKGADESNLLQVGVERALVSHLALEPGKLFHLHCGASLLYQPQSQRIRSHWWAGFSFS